MTSRQAKLKEDRYFGVIRFLQENPDLTQRGLAENLSLGGLNYRLKALAEKDLVKIRGFSNSKNKFG
jgi:hypothetical protein